MVYLGPLKCDFKNPATSLKKAQLKPFFNSTKINILCVEFLKLSNNEIWQIWQYCILEISHSLMIIPLLTHYTKPTL